MRLSDISRRLAVLCFLLAWSGHDSSAAEHRVRVVVSFSILGDIAQQIGGSDVAVTSLIGPDSDAHVFEPSPDQARVLASAQLFIVNGLGLEGWETRLVQSAQYRGPVVVASDGVTPIEANEPGTADPAHGEAYRGRFDRYRAQLEALDRQVRAELSAIPALKRRVITTHDAFAYYGKTYGVTFLAPEGLSTDSEPSAEAIAKLIRQIRREGIKALFLEN